MRSEFENAYRHFLQSSQLYLLQIRTLYTEFKTFRAAFYAYRNSFFQQSHLLPRDISHHNSYFPHSLSQSCKNWLLKNFGKVAKLTPGILSGFEAICYELQIVLEVTMLPKGVFFVHGIPMNTKSATYNIF